MKRIIFMVFLLIFAACTPSVKDAMSDETPSPKLSAIDSLMWQRPDSALAVLMDFAASPKADSLDVFDGHYFQLLVSELLYKNDYEQSNRPDLLRAVSCFDSLSLAVTNKSIKRHLIAGADPLSPTRSGDLVFLDARAHYINGVGYYERDSVVEACVEYLKALEIMESHFAEKKLVGKNARFMALINNRFGELFSAQFMSDLSIICYENSLAFCKIEPTSLFCVSNTLLFLGKQYDKIGEKHKARQYYEQAISALPNIDNVVYRDITAMMALCDYQCGAGFEYSLTALHQVLALANSKVERLTRFLTIGGVFFEEKMYDSAIFYLEPVFECDDKLASRIQAADCLHVIYSNRGDKEKTNEYAHFLADYRKPEGQNKILVSQLESLFQHYIGQKREKEAAMEKREAIEKTLRKVVLTAVFVGVALFFALKRQHNKRMREQQAEAHQMLEEKEQELTSKEGLLKRNEAMAEQRLETERKRHAEAMEIERQTHKMQQSALSGRLKRSNQELRELKGKMSRKEVETSKPITQASDFDCEPICRLIMERVNDGQFKSQMDCILYKRYALSKEQMLSLREAVDRHFNGFTLRLAKTYPELTQTDLDYCCLYLLGLTDADVSALMQKAYSTISQRTRKIKAVFGKDAPLGTALRNFANDILY